MPRKLTDSTVLFLHVLKCYFYFLFFEGEVLQIIFVIVKKMGITGKICGKFGGKRERNDELYYNLKN